MEQASGRGLLVDVADEPPVDAEAAQLLQSARERGDEVERQSDIIVLLARSSDAELVRLARLFPALDVVISGSPTSEGREFPKTGNTVMVESAHGGIALGMLEIAWDAAGRIQKSANTMIPLPPQVPEDSRLAEIAEKSHRETLAMLAALVRGAGPVATRSPPGFGNTTGVAVLVRLVGGVKPWQFWPCTLSRSIPCVSLPHFIAPQVGALRMPLTVSRKNAAAMASSEGNSRVGKMPARATASQIVPATRNGNALRQMERQRGSVRGVTSAAYATASVMARSCRCPCGRTSAWHFR